MFLVHLCPLLLCTELRSLLRPLFVFAATLHCLRDHCRAAWQPLQPRVEGVEEVERVRVKVEGARVSMCGRAACEQACRVLNLGTCQTFISLDCAIVCAIEHSPGMPLSVVASRSAADSRRARSRVSISGSSGIGYHPGHMPPSRGRQPPTNPVRHTCTSHDQNPQ